MSRQHPNASCALSSIAGLVACNQRIFVRWFWNIGIQDQAAVGGQMHRWGLLTICTVPRRGSTRFDMQAMHVGEATEPSESIASKHLLNAWTVPRRITGCYRRTHHQAAWWRLCFEQTEQTYRAATLCLNIAFVLACTQWWCSWYYCRRTVSSGRWKSL